MFVDLADKQLISTFNKGILLCVTDIFVKYAWTIHLKNKRDMAITNAFQMNSPTIFNENISNT